MFKVNVYYVLLCYYARLKGDFGGLFGVNRSVNQLWHVDTAK